MDAGSIKALKIFICPLKLKTQIVFNIKDKQSCLIASLIFMPLVHKLNINGYQILPRG